MEIHFELDEHELYNTSIINYMSLVLSLVFFESQF